MADRALAAKKPETKKESPPQVRKLEHFQPVSSPVDRILYLQRTAGNQAVQGLIRSGALQAKLRVGPPGDKYEEEADRVAQQVVAFKRTPSLHPESIARTTGKHSLLDEGKKEVRRKTEPISETSIIPVNDNYILNPGPGEPLNTSTRGSIESYTGADLGNVRVHDDGASHAAAGALNARAFTYREHIWLGSGESKTDLRLMAHETTHVLQQGASVQRLPVAVTPAPPVVQRGLLDYIGDPKEKLLEKAAQWVDNIPGFYLLTVILGKNPVTDKPVERNAINLIRGFLGMVPGGEAIFQNLQKSGAIDQAFAWLNDQIAKLNLTWDYIKSLFRQAWDALSATDIFSPSKAIEKIKAVFGPPLERIKNFAVAVGKKIAEFIFEGVLKLAGPLGTRVLEIVRKAGDVLSTIIHDPIGFIGNLIQAVRKGFDQFSTNILAHLKEGLMKWLFGALAGAGLRLPEKFDLMGILSLVLQILALTYDRLRGLLVKAIGEKPVAYLEKTFEFLTTLVTKGLGAAWEKLVEFLGDLKEMVLGGIRDWVVTTIVKKAITKVASMFNPVGAVIQAIIMVYDTIKFFIERFQQIAELANAVFESVANIAAGKIEAAASYVEKTMARTIPVIIGFLASLIGLGGISQKIKDIIKTIQDKVESALSKLVSFIVSKVKGLLGKGEEKPKEKKLEDTEGVKNDVKKELASKLPKDIKSADEIRPIIDNVYNKYRSEGLKSLEVVQVPKKAGEFEIVATASPGLNVFSFYFVRSDLQLKFPRTALLAEMNNIPLTRERNKKGKHAEEWLLENLRKDWNHLVDEGIVKKNKPNVLTITITRSPCDEPDHQCARKLIKFAKEKDLILDLRIVSAYHNEEAVDVLKMLREKGHELSIWDAVEDVKVLFGNDLSDKEIKELEKELKPKIEKAQEILKSIKGK
jgi:hypothetical protein